MNKKKQYNKKSKKLPQSKLSFEGKVSPQMYQLQPSSKVSYVDLEIGTNQSTVFQPLKLLDPLIGAGGLLRTFPQLCKVAAGGSSNTPKWYKNILVTDVEFNLNMTGSQANTLVAADLFNRIRTVIWETKFPYSATTIASWDTQSLTDWTRVNKVHYDQVCSLSSRAFDSGNYNSPATKNLRGRLPVNHRFDCKSTTTAGGLPTSFDTDEDNIFIGFVSDSLAIPNPSIAGAARLYYIELD